MSLNASTKSWPIFEKCGLVNTLFLLWTSVSWLVCRDSVVTHSWLICDSFWDRRVSFWGVPEWVTTRMSHTSSWLILGPLWLILGRPRMNHDANESHVFVTHWLILWRPRMSHDENESHVVVTHSSWLILGRKNMCRDAFALWRPRMSHEWVTNESRISHDECVTTQIFIAKTERLSMTHSHQHRDSSWDVTHLRDSFALWLILGCEVTH